MSSLFADELNESVVYFIEAIRFCTATHNTGQSVELENLDEKSDLFEKIRNELESALRVVLKCSHCNGNEFSADSNKKRALIFKFLIASHCQPAQTLLNPQRLSFCLIINLAIRNNLVNLSQVRRCGRLSCLGIKKLNI
jgi:hypothetical protein